MDKEYLALLKQGTKVVRLDPEFNETLQCFASLLLAHKEMRAVHIVLADDSVTDMRGAIKLAQQHLPEVVTITTGYANNVYSSVYLLSDDGVWTAVPVDKCAIEPLPPTPEEVSGEGKKFKLLKRGEF